LPALNETPASPRNKPAPVRDEYLYTYVNTLGNEGIGVRVANNTLHLSAAEWYASQGFKGSLQETTVDGYDAVKDGSTTYVNAPALSFRGELYEYLHSFFFGRRGRGNAEYFRPDFEEYAFCREPRWR